MRLRRKRSSAMPKRQRDAASTDREQATADGAGDVCSDEEEEHAASAGGGTASSSIACRGEQEMQLVLEKAQMLDILVEQNGCSNGAELSSLIARLRQGQAKKPREPSDSAERSSRVAAQSGQATAASATQSASDATG